MARLERCRRAWPAVPSRRLLGVAAVVLLAAATGRADDGGWRTIDGPPALGFPADHGAHPDTGTEWWYLTANLTDGGGRRYGVQLTFFRQGIDAAPARPTDSVLRARQALAAHLAVAEVDDRRFRHAERVRRADGIFAGFAVGDLELWLGEWRLERRADGVLSAVAGDRASGIAVELDYRPRKPLVRQGVEGYSRKGPEPGNASAYLSFTRLEVSGTLTVDGRRLEVAGGGWFDHEWGTSQLGPGVVGWDWFSLRLDDGRDLMVYRLRRDDGRADRFSSGSLVAGDGAVRRLERDDVELEVGDHWTSPATGARYPSRWRLRVPSAGLDLFVQPAIEDAELDGRASTGVVYWEGPVTVSGSHGGEGYAELTGYAGSLEGRF